MFKYIVITLIVLALILGSMYAKVAYNQSEYVKEVTSTLEKGACSNEPPRSDAMLNSYISSVRKIYEVDKSCKSTSIRTLTYPIVYPTSPTLDNVVSSVSKDIINYRQNNIKIILVINLPADYSERKSEYLNDTDSNILVPLFSGLKQSGVSEDDIDSIILFPFPNLPLYKGVYISPEDFANIYNTNSKYTNLEFNVPVGTYLSTSTYEEAPVDWLQKDYRDPQVYLSKLDTVKVIGFMGFPYSPTLDESSSEPDLMVSEYLQINQVKQYLKDHRDINVHFVTGVPVLYKAAEEKNNVVIPYYIRSKILLETSNLLSSIDSGNTSVVLIQGISNPLFTKYSWEFFGSDITEDPANLESLVDFLKDMNSVGIDVAWGTL